MYFQLFPYGRTEENLPEYYLLLLLHPWVIMPQKRVSSFLAFFKNEILSLLKLPSRKQMETPRFRIHSTVIELQPPVTTQKRIRRQSENAKQKDQELSKMNEPRPRPRSTSAPQTIRIEQHRISRTTETRQNKLCKTLPRRASIKRSSQVRAIQGPLSTVVEIKLN